MPKNHMKADPTRTSLLRHAFEREVKRRTNDLKKKITDALVVEDVFGMRLGAGPRIMKGGLQILERYAFQSDAEKVKSFQSWVKQEIDDGYLELENGADPATPWTSSYINSAYRKGVASSYIAGYGETAQEPVQFTDMSRERFLQSTMASAVSVNRLAILGSRAFEQMKGMTAQISQDLSRELATGMANGYGAKKLAKNISDSIDSITKRRALTIARTEIIHAHAEGQLDALEAQGVESVQADVEFATAGDDRVCPLCAGLEGTVITIAQARGVIPVHPNCRCAWLPVIASRKTKKKSNTDAAILGAKEGSVSNKINQVIDEIPRSSQEISGLSGVPLARVKAHLKWLQERKAVKEVDGKWVMTDTAIGAKKTIAGTKTKPVPTPTPTPTPTPVSRFREVSLALQADFESMYGLRLKRIDGSWTADRVSDVKDDMTRMAQQHPGIVSHTTRTGVPNEMFLVKTTKHHKKALGTCTLDMTGKTTIEVTDKLKKSFADLTIGRWGVDESTTGVLRHEMGHLVHRGISSDLKLKFDMAVMKVKKDPGGVKAGISQYGATDNKEAFAEAFCAWTHADYGKPGVDRLPEAIEDVMSKITGRKMADDLVPVPKPTPTPKPDPVPEPVPKPVPTPAPQPKPLPKPEVAPGAKPVSVAEQITRALDAEPRTPQEIAERSGAPLSRVKAHMKWLEARGRAKQVDGKWASTDALGVAPTPTSDDIPLIKIPAEPNPVPLPKPESIPTPTPKEVDVVVGIDKKIAELTREINTKGSTPGDWKEASRMREEIIDLEKKRNATYETLWEKRRAGEVPQQQTVLPEALDEVVKLRSSAVNDFEGWVEKAFGISADEVSKKLQKTVDKADVMMAVRTTHLKKIFSEGEFKNSLQTGRGSFKTIGAERAIKEREMFGITASPDNPELYPKYGFLTKPGVHNDEMVGGGYGEVFVKFKRQNIEDKTTITFGDSLNNNQGANVATPARLNEINYQVMSRHAISGYKTPDSEYVRKMVKLDDIDTYGGEYVEAQIYGKLTTNDVEAIYTSSKKEKIDFEKMLKKAGRKDIKVLPLARDGRLKALKENSYSGDALRRKASLTPDDIDRLGDVYIEKMQQPEMLSNWKDYRLPPEINEIMAKYDRNNKQLFTIADRRELAKRFSLAVQKGEKGGLPKELYKDYRASYANWTADVLNEELLKGIE